MAKSTQQTPLQKMAEELWNEIRLFNDEASSNKGNPKRARYREGGSIRITHLLPMLARAAIGQKPEASKVHNVLATFCHDINVTKPFASHNKDTLVSFAPWFLSKHCPRTLRSDRTIEEFRGVFRNALIRSQQREEPDHVLAARLESVFDDYFEMKQNS